LNTGVPASLPPGSSPWEDDPDLLPRAPAAGGGDRPEWGPPDPAAVSGPPWPVLVASGPYTPPDLLRWPVAVGVAAVLVYLLSVIISGGSGPGVATSQASWLAANDRWIVALNRDQDALRADTPAAGTPAAGASQARWLADWQHLRDDAEAAAAAPSPGGRATVPWREMLNDYAAGSSAILQGLATRNPAEVAAAGRDVVAGDAAARRFNQAMPVIRS
jgi:hypothetical protein